MGYVAYHEMIQEAASIVRQHWTGGISGAAIVHIAHLSFGWLKANNGLRGAWATVMGKPTVNEPSKADKLIVQPEQEKKV